MMMLINVAKYKCNYKNQNKKKEKEIEKWQEDTQLNILQYKVLRQEHKK
jgi:hypothetical protein